MALDPYFKTAAGTAVVFADSTDYSPTNSGYTRTAQIDLTSLAAGKARQSDKATLPETRDDEFAVRVGIEFDVAPTAGKSVYVYWSASVSGTAATGNDGGCSGTDSAYKDGEEAEWLKQLQLIGILTVTADAATTVQYSTVGVFSPPTRYGQIVVYNAADQAFEGDAVEMFVALDPIVRGAEAA